MPPIRMRPTSRQILGRAVTTGLVTAGLVAIPMVAVALLGELVWWELALLPLACVTGALLAYSPLRRVGVDLDETGIHPVLPGPARREYAPWHHIHDIRAERRRARTVPVVYLDGGRSWRLRVPYDGLGLGKDPHFDEKLATIRNLWELHQRRRRD